MADLILDVVLLFVEFLWSPGGGGTLGSHRRAQASSSDAPRLRSADRP